MTKLDKPNTNPIPAPFSLPKTIPAIMTGMCRVVARKGPTGMNPKKGIITMRISIAIKSDMNARFFVFCLFIFFLHCRFIMNTTHSLYLLKDR